MLERHEFPVLFVAGPQRRRAASRTLEPDRRRSWSMLGHRVVEAETLIDGRALVGSDPSFGAVVLDWDVAEPDGELEARAVLDAARRLQRPPAGVPDARPRRRRRAARSRCSTRRARSCSCSRTRRRSSPDGSTSPGAGTSRRCCRRSSARSSSSPTPTSTRCTPPGTPAARRFARRRSARRSTTSTARTCSAPTSRSRSASSARCSTIPGASVRRSATRRGSSVRETTFFVLNGTSTANQIVAHSAIVAGDVVLADRNCHKSMNYALAVTDAIPVYLRPVRNGYGIIGPIPAERARPGADRARRSPRTRWRASPPDRAPVYAAITNSTYDGLCYDAGEVVAAARHERAAHPLRRGVVRLRAFNPLYRDRSRDARVSAEPRLADAVRDAVDAQAARRVLAGVDDPHPLERARARRAGALQRGLHDARLDLAVLSDDRRRSTSPRR